MKDGSATPIYRVLKPVVLVTDRQLYMPGDIVDLSHLPPESRKWFVDRGFYETADGTPKNVPVPYEDIKSGKVKTPCRNC